MQESQCSYAEKNYVPKRTQEIHNDVKSKLTVLLNYHELRRYTHIPTVRDSTFHFPNQNARLLPDWLR